MSIGSELKAVYDLIRSIQRDVKDAALQRAISEVLAKLNDVLFQLGDQIRATLEFERENQRLRQGNAEMKQWDQDKEQHVLKHLSPGVYVYAAKDLPGAGGATENKGPYLCPNCYQQRKKAMLQLAVKGFDGSHYRCHSCGLEVVDSTDRVPSEILIAKVREPGCW